MAATAEEVEVLELETKLVVCQPPISPKEGEEETKTVTLAMYEEMWELIWELIL